MFAIATKQEQYETYILTDQQAQSQLEVIPARGGIISRWRSQGEEILYFDTERFQNPNLSIRGGIPILFPICGNLPDNTYTYAGERYLLKQHGFARDLPWQVIDQVTDHLASITLSLRSNQQTLAVYPFEFELHFTYQIQGNTLEIRQLYKNHSSQPMPFSTGLHPYFWVSDKSQLQFDIAAVQYQDQITQKVQPFSGSFDWKQDEIDVAFKSVQVNLTTVTDTRRGLKISLSYSELYSTLVFWTVKGKDYYCLEPWTAPRNALITGESLIQLPPGESLEVFVRLSAVFSRE